jgi:hypothetical protein
MNTEKLKICWNVFERVGTDLKPAGLSNKVGTAVLIKKKEWSEFGGISGFVCPVGTVGTETSVPENRKEVSDAD